MAQARKQTTESLVCPYNSLLIFDATSLHVTSGTCVFGRWLFSKCETS